MTDFQTALSCLRRPRLLLRAARLGLDDYNRNKDLKRIMRQQDLPTPAKAVGHLIEAEAELERTRASGDGTYSVIRHVEVMIALMAEARFLPAPD